jgi:DNA adenine methylase
VSNPAQRYTSPLRYPGGKAQVVKFLKLLMLENGLVGSTYVEPYAGGASVALSLLFEDYVSSVQINDLNLGIYDFWQNVLYQTDAFCRMIEEVPLTVEEWQRQRSIAVCAESTSFERGFATFYQNRTNRSGIISGGVIGGLKQTGSWKLDARFPRAELVRRIQKIARFRSRIKVSRCDALELLQSAPNVGCFYFLDPPYYARGARLYDNFYDHDDHQEICHATANLKAPWIVSYDAAPEIIEMYCQYHMLRYSLAYSTNSRERGSEVMFSAPGLTMPQVLPSDVSARRVEDARLHDLMVPLA